jgi:polysaccharide biosynthesis transport protein
MTLDGAQLAALNSELIRVQAELAEKRAKLGTLRALRSGKQGFESVPEVLASPVMANLRQQQTELLRQRAQESQEYGPRHPRILQLQADQRELEQKIRTEIQNIVGAFERDVAVTENRERMLRQSLAQTKGHVVQNNQAEVQLGQLEREAEANRALYTTFLERFKTLTEQQEVLEPGVEVISAAAVPSTRSFPQPNLIIAAGFTSSLVFATLLAFVAESLENGLRSGRQIEEALGLANLGIVPWVKGGFKLHHYLAQKPRSAYAEAVRSLHIGMKFANLNRPPKIILVTSSLPNEGKTTLALSLGASTAAAGHKTVVVDLDLRHPSVRRELNQPVTAPGLIEFIAGEATLEQVTHIDELQPNLHVVTVRRNPSNPIDLIGSQRMSALMTQLRSRYKYVILDAPPVLGISDTRLAALLADAVLFVVRWGKTKAEVAQNAVNALRESHAPVAGAVLTQVDIERHAKRAYGDAVEYYGQYKQYYID